MDEQHNGNAGLKKCPFCAELIKQEAIYCRYCRRDLPQFREDVAFSNHKPISERNSSIKWKPLSLIILGIIIIAVIIGGIYFQNLYYTNADTENNNTSQTETEIKDVYVNQLSRVAGDFIDNVFIIKSITSSQDAYTTFLDKNKFNEQVYPTIAKIKEDQTLLENLNPPEKFREIHEEIVTIFNHFTDACIAIESWSRTNDLTDLDEAAMNIQIFDNNLSRLEELILVINDAKNE